MLLVPETASPGAAGALDRLHRTVAAALSRIAARATEARTLVGADERAARAAIAAVRGDALDALDDVRALVAALPDAAGRALADDVHDTLGHALSLASLLAGGAAARLAEEPALARDALGQVATTAADTVTELERLLASVADGAARRAPDGHSRSAADAADDGPAGVAPPADLALLAELALHQPVTFDVDGELLAAAPPRVAAAVYRIVRESLTNARRHARGAAVHVRLADEDGAGGALTVTVVNAPATSAGRPGSGQGIPGMRRRAHALGGSFASGPTADGGFRVRARLPR